VRITLEVTWNERTPTNSSKVSQSPQNTDIHKSVELGVTEGSVMDAWEQSGDGSPFAHEFRHCRLLDVKGAEPTWELGTTARGAARIRIEAPLTAELLVRAHGKQTQFPIAALLDGPQKSASDGPVDILIQRVAWDAIELQSLESEGIAAPGAVYPIALGFNVLSHETTDIGLQYSLELRPIRSNQVLWRSDPRPEVISTNKVERQTRQISVPMPIVEGLYVLEVRANWDPVSSLEGSALSRLLRRKKNGPSGSAVRKGTVLVMGSSGPRLADKEVASGVTIVDQLDLTRPHPARPTVAGRSQARSFDDQGWDVPPEATIEPRLRERIRGWIARPGEPVVGPATKAGLAWTAVELRAGHLGRPHRLTLAVSGDEFDALGVALIVPESASVRPRLLLDACVASRSGSERDGTRVFSWIVWPDHPAPVLVVFNRGERSAVTLKAVNMEEYAGDPPAARITETHPNAPRNLALQLSSPDVFDRFGGTVDGAAFIDRFSLTRNLRGYVLHCGASSVVVPDSLADRRIRKALDGQYDEDSLGPDTLEVLLRTLSVDGISVVLEVGLDGPIDNLPAPDSDEARTRGLSRIDAKGHVHSSAYQLLRPEVRTAAARHFARVLEPGSRHKNLAGLQLPLGPGSSLLGPIETGIDDWTYSEFVRAKFPAQAASQIPGLSDQSVDRFTARARFVTGAGRTAWLEWRAEQLGLVYSELAAEVAKSAPGATLLIVTPCLDEGLAGKEARRVDQLGEPADLAWQALGLDFRRWDANAPGLVVLRGVSRTGDELSSDLATSPELDRAVVHQGRRGLWISSSHGAMPDGRSNQLVLLSRPAGHDEMLGHAMAVIDPSVVVMTLSAVTGAEEQIARFARVFRGVPRPAPDGRQIPPLVSGVALRSWQSQGRTYLLLANDTPYEILQAAVVSVPAKTPIDDIGRGARLEPTEAPGGGQSLVLRLPPFAVTAVRIASPDAAIEPGGSYLTAMASLESQADGLSSRLVRSDAFIGPLSPGFEPDDQAVRAAASASNTKLTKVQSDGIRAREVKGWSILGDTESELSLDSNQPHGGQAALRLDARSGPVSIISDDFLTPAGAIQTVRIWMRSDRPDARVRVHIEGSSPQGHVARQAEVPVSTEWAERVIRIPDLPDDGLDWMVLRLEWGGPAPGSLWIDDISVQGQGPSETGRRAHRVLLEAVQAYRAKRYADFARLLGSRRARHAVPDLEHIQAPALRTGQTTDLPPGRRLR
jgi:hypothetical protein